VLNIGCKNDLIHSKA